MQQIISILITLFIDVMMLTLTHHYNIIEYTSSDVTYQKSLFKGEKFVNITMVNALGSALGMFYPMFIQPLAVS